LVNIPLTGAVGDAGFRRILSEIVAPAARRFQPELVLVSAGYDAHWDDPLASMRLTVTGYTQIARALKELAQELCGGRLVFTLEGGYHLQALAYSVMNTFGVLLGDAGAVVVDPLGPSPYGERGIDDSIAQVRRIHGL
jgi:acetoin utilization deacetylase AcuC-like enzyme